jgi:hypothetical protein
MMFDGGKDDGVGQQVLTDDSPVYQLEALQSQLEAPDCPDDSATDPGPDEGKAHDRKLPVRPQLHETMG